MALINKLLVGESLVGDGNEVAHIDLLIGPRGSAAELAFANALVNNKDGFTTLLAVVAPNLPDQAEHDPVQQGHDQGRQAGRADVRPGAARRRQGGRRLGRRGHDPGRRSRRPVHLRRRVHSLGRHGRREDPGLQLHRHEGSSSRAPSRASRRPPRSSPSATTPSTPSPPTKVDAKAARPQGAGSRSAPRLRRALRREGWAAPMAKGQKRETTIHRLP